MLGGPASPTHFLGDVFGDVPNAGEYARNKKSGYAMCWILNRRQFERSRIAVPYLFDLFKDLISPAISQSIAFTRGNLAVMGAMPVAIRFHSSLQMFTKLLKTDIPLKP